MIFIQHGTVMDPKSHLNAQRDVLIGDNGIISGIGERISPPDGCRILDADGCIVCPGLIDTHSHFRDPGFLWKEDIHTGCLAAAAGGYTTVLMMANTKPPIDCTEVLSDVLTRGAKEAIHVYSGVNVTKGMSGRELTDMEALAEAGAAVFTDDGVPILREELLEEALLRAAALNLPVSLHEEDPRYISQNGIHGGGRAAASFGIGGSPREAEISMIRRDTALAARTGGKLVIQHISTAEGVDLVRQARKINPLIQAEATPHHFSLTEEAVLRTGSLAKVNPPIRTEEDRLAIIEGMQDGTIRFIATDHAPHSDKEKAAEPIWKAPSGMIGLETALSLAIDRLVNPGYLSMSDMLALLTCNPAEYYGLPGGELTVGGPADIAVFHPGKTWTVSRHFASKSHNSPFIGETLPGVVRWTICAGRVVYERCPQE